MAVCKKCKGKRIIVVKTTVAERKVWKERGLIVQEMMRACPMCAVEPDDLCDARGCFTVATTLGGTMSLCDEHSAAFSAAEDAATWMAENIPWSIPLEQPLEEDA